MEKTIVVDTSCDLCRLIDNTGPREPDVKDVSKEFDGPWIYFHQRCLGRWAKQLSRPTAMNDAYEIIKPFFDPIAILLITSAIRGRWWEADKPSVDSRSSLFEREIPLSRPWNSVVLPLTDRRDRKICIFATLVCEESELSSCSWRPLTRFSHERCDSLELFFVHSHSCGLFNMVIEIARSSCENHDVLVCPDQTVNQNSRTVLCTLVARVLAALQGCV